MDFSGLGSYKNEERKGFMERKHRRKMVLPHLSYSCKKQVETQDKSLPKPKLEDLMIGTILTNLDIHKDNTFKQQFHRDKSLQEKAVTPGPKRQVDIE